MPPTPGFVEVLAPLTSDVTNMVINPSVETNLTGYTVSSGTIVQDATNQRRGVYAVKWTPGSNTDFMVYDHVTLQNAITYYFTVDVGAPAGVSYQICFANLSNVAVSAFTTFTGTGFWQRISVSWLENAGPVSRRLLIQQVSNANRNPVWLDGWMCTPYFVNVNQNGSNIAYIDGDQPSCYWQGAPHASQSVGIAQSRDTGTWVNFDAFNTGIEGWAGLGMPPVKNVLIPYGLPDGSNYQRTKALQRPFNINVFTGGNAWTTPVNTLLLMHKYRRQLIDTFKSDAISQPAPFWLRFGADPSWNLQRPLKIQAAYDHGDELTYLPDSDGSLGFITHDSLAFVAPNPYLYEDGNAGFVFSALSAASAGNANCIAFAPNRQQWNNIGTGVAGATPTVRAILFNPYDGRFYIGYTSNTSTSSMNAVGSTAGICVYDPIAGTISALGGGCTLANASGNGVYTLALAPNGDVIAGGFGINSFGVAGTQNIARWSISSGVWQSIATTGTGSNLDFVTALAVYADGTIVAGGTFSTIGGTTAANIAFRTPAGTWTAMGTGASAQVWSMAIGLDGNTLYIGGAFVTVNGITVNHVASWSKSAAAFSALGTGTSAGTCFAITVSLSGLVYFGGSFVTINGLTVNNIASWNGTQFSTVGASGITGGTVEALITDQQSGVIYIGGTSFTSAGGVTPVNGFVIWNGSSFILPDINLPNGNSAVVYAYATDSHGDRLIGFDQTGATVTSAQFQTLNNTASAVGRAIFKFAGPGTLYLLRNATTGDAIAFNLKLAAGEIATLTLSALGSSFVSNFRGNILGTVLPGSNLSTFRLLPSTSTAAGANVLEVLMTGTTGASLGTVQWLLAHWSLDSVDQN